MSSSSTKNLTILLTDIKGFTDKTSRQTRSQILDMLERHKAVVQPVLEGRGGRLVKTIGDAYLMAYDSPTDAVLAGIAVQDALRAHNEGRPQDDRIEVRVAINCGEVTLADNDVFGEPVNITARIEAVAEAGEVFFTEAVYLAMNKTEVPSSEVGLLQLKGIPEKVRVYKVKRETPVSATSVVERSALREAAPKASYANAGAGVSAAGPAAGVAAGTRPAPAAPGFSPVISCGAIPSAWKRLGALCLDAVLCGMLASMFAPHHTRLMIGKKQGQPAQVYFTKDGVKVDAKDADISISPTGVSVTPKAAAAPSPSTRSRTAVADDRGDDDGSFWDDKRTGWLQQWSFSIAWFLYSLICLKRFGTTLGGRLFKLTVVRMDGQPLDKGDRLMRAATSLLSGYCLGLGFFWGLWERDGRGWHDLLANTRVVSN